MNLITNSRRVKSLCDELQEEPFVCLDTEFIREKTYWPKLCLIQITGPQAQPYAIDPLVDDIDLSPFFALLANHNVIKVLHAARQDIEIFLNLSGRIPKPIFDTQIAAMVCGYGESSSYETLTRKIANARIDKSSRFSDWSGRPLEDRQLKYALSDVRHLPQIYATLRQYLSETNRENWIADEVAALEKIETYVTEPKNAWKKIKTRGANPQTMAVLREVTAVREEWARHCNIPRQHAVRDQSLLEISSSRPTSPADLARIRGFPANAAKGELGHRLLKAVDYATTLDSTEWPQQLTRSENIKAPGATVDLLKVLLKLRCDQHSIATRLVASSLDLLKIASGNEDTPAVLGWRKEIFGDDALKLVKGKLSLTIEKGQVHLQPNP